MLKRKATNFMKNWINTKDKKCLVVQGARQTGKTYTVERFAEENYEELGFAVQKGNTELLEKINAGLANVKENGVYDELVEKWEMS